MSPCAKPSLKIKMMLGRLGSAAMKEVAARKTTASLERNCHIEEREVQKKPRFGTEVFSFKWIALSYLSTCRSRRHGRLLASCHGHVLVFRRSTRRWSTGALQPKLH